MGKRIAKFLVAVPLTAGFIVNTNIKNENTNKNLVPSNTNSNQVSEDQSVSLKVKDEPLKRNRTKIVLASAKKTNPAKIAVQENAPKKSTDEMSSKDVNASVIPEQLAVMEKMVAGYPIEKMIPEIAKRNPVTAAFIVAIAKKESNWGKVSPRSKDGDCFNYWGFKDHRFKFAAGHSCFPSRESAVEAVGNRIDKLVANGRGTPAKLSVWKCGSACSKDGNVGKWISDVNLYFQPIVAAADVK